MREHWGASEQQVYNYKPRVETVNSDRFTRMCPQIYGCVSMCMDASVFRKEMLCTTQDKLVFVRVVHNTQSASQSHSLGKMERGAYYDPGPEF